MSEVPHVDYAPMNHHPVEMTIAAGPRPTAAVSRMLEDLSSALMPAVRSNEAAAVSAARRLSGAMLMAGPREVHASIVGRPAVVTQLVADLVRSFSFDPSGVLLLIHTNSRYEQCWMLLCMTLLKCVNLVLRLLNCDYYTAILY